MKSISLIVISLSLLLAISVDCSELWPRWLWGSSGIGSKSESGVTNKSTTGIPAQETTGPIPVKIPVTATTTTTSRPGGSNNNGGVCWWTPCKSRCPGGATVNGANKCDTGGYKFECCNGKSL